MFFIAQVILALTLQATLSYDFWKYGFWSRDWSAWINEYTILKI